MNNTINGRTPDEIKKGLEHCSEDGCKRCPYEEDCNMADGFSVLAYDALAYIQQLERERDAAVEDLHGLCSVCKHNNTKVCDSCTHTASIFEVYGDADNWEWRGKQDARE